MPNLSEKNREIWEYLFHDGRELTAAEISKRLDRPTEDVFWSLNGMARRCLVMSTRRSTDRRLRYSVNGTCLVPQGMRVAEVQG